MPSVSAAIVEGARRLGLKPIAPEHADKAAAYLEVLARWNEKISLTAIRDKELLMSRHVLEGFFVQQALSQGIGRVLDFGSGTGVPGVLIAIGSPEIVVSLAEARQKKAAFLREVVRVLELRAEVLMGRVEDLGLEGSYDAVTLRAVEQMENAAEAAGRLVVASGQIYFMSSEQQEGALRARLPSDCSWRKLPMPRSKERLLLIATK